MSVEAYPLYWPEGKPRRESWRREGARFGTSFGRARDAVVRQIELLTGTVKWNRDSAKIVISTNLALRRDGLPLANQRNPDDRLASRARTDEGARMTYDLHQTRWAHNCALAIEKIVPLDGPAMARVERALLERWPVPAEATQAMLDAGAATPGMKMIDGIVGLHCIRTGMTVPEWIAPEQSALAQAWRAMVAAAQEKP